MMDYLNGKHTSSPSSQSQVHLILCPWKSSYSIGTSSINGDFPLPDSDSDSQFRVVKDQPTVLGQVDNQNKSETKFDILGMIFLW